MGDWDEQFRADPDGPRRAGENARKWTPPGANGAGDDAGDDAAPDQFELTRLSDIEAASITWLWQDRIAEGKLMLLGGDPDLGKSLICCDVAARLSTQTHWPNGPRPRKAGDTIFLCSEDDAADTIKPRCMAAGANLDRLHVFKMRTLDGKHKTFSLQDDLAMLGEAINRTGAVLICVDALTSYMGQIDSHRTTDVRSVLEPLADFAKDHRVAIVGVTHPPKAAQGSALKAYTGSYAFVAAPRTAFLVTPEVGTDRRLLLAVKNNIGQKARGIGYRVRTKVITDTITAPYILWSDEPVDQTADQAIAAAHADAKDGGASKDAESFLQEFLKGGPVAATEAEEAADAHGISARTLRRARKKLGVKPYKDGYQGHWLWRLPEAAP
jgi:putative DNA primase/helicase